MENSTDSIRKKIQESFDFKTTYACPVRLNYGRQAYVEVFTENPLDEYSNKKDITPVYCAYTDEKGVLNSRMEIPEALKNKEVYVYTDAIGIPGLVQTKISTSGLTVDINNTSRVELGGTIIRSCLMILFLK